MNIFSKKSLLEIFCKLVATLAICGMLGCGSSSEEPGTAGIDGSGKDAGGIDGSGLIASGPIRDFGSIILEGGLCFDLTNAEITIDGQPAQESDLLLGYFVTVAGDKGLDENCGKADRVIYETYLRGPIQSIEASEGGEYKVINVLNKFIIVSRSSTETVFGPGATFDSLAVGQRISVSGRLLDGEVLLTTRLDLVPASDASIKFPSTVVAINGNVIAVADGYSVDIARATRIGFEVQDLQVGQLIDIQGTLTGATTIEATSIALRSNSGQLDALIALSQALTVKGEVADFNENTLNIAGVAVNTEAASIFPSFVSLQDGLSVAVSGDYANSTLSATSVVLQRLYEEGTVIDVENTSGKVSILLEAYGETITVDISDNTLITDNRNGIAQVPLADILAGDLVVVSVRIDESQSYIAQEITRISEFTGATTTDPAGILINVNITNLYTLEDALFVQNFTQSDTGTLEIVITQTGHGAINALETVNISGDLIVSTSGATFAEGDEFDIFQGRIQGTFTSIAMPELDEGLSWDLSRFYQNGIIRVVQSQPMEIAIDTRLGSNTVSLKFFGSVLGAAEIDWGDGSSPVALDSVANAVSHTYTLEGPYTIIISGSYTGFGWENATPPASEVEAIQGVTQWGNASIFSLHGAFRNHPNLSNLPSNLPAAVTDLTCLICGASTYTGTGMNSWDVSNVVVMDNLLEGVSNFNTVISNWNVSSVQSMSRMFKNSNFNQSIENWDVNSVVDMTQMFAGVYDHVLVQTAADFPTAGHKTIYINQRNNIFDLRIFEYDNVAYDYEVTNLDDYYISRLDELFDGTHSGIDQEISIALTTAAGHVRVPAPFNQPLRNWAGKLGSVQTMQGLFRGTNFNQNISAWDVSKVQNMTNMFMETTFNQDISQWRVGKVTSMQGMFANSNFNQAIDANALTGAWDVSNVTDMSYMFYDSFFNQEIRNWDVSAVTSMEAMFFQSSFNRDIPDWRPVQVTNMYFMFGESNFTGDVSNWVLGNVRTMEGLFYDTFFNGDISKWDVSTVVNMRDMFRASTFNGDLGAWNVESVQIMDDLFRANDIFRGTGLENWKPRSAISMDSVFADASAFNADLSTWAPYLKNVTYMQEMFKGASSFNADISAWDVSSVDDMGFMFRNASSFNQDLSGWNIALVDDFQRFLDGATSFSVENYDRLLQAWSNQNVRQGVTFGADGRTYSSLATAARQSLIDDNGWIFVGDSQSP